MENMIRLQPGFSAGATASRRAWSLMPRRMFQRPILVARDWAASPWARTRNTRCSTARLTNPRIAFWAAGTLRSTRRSIGEKVRSTRGSTHDGVRWKTLMWATSSTMVGMICTAEAPVPMMPTRVPVRSRSGCHRAEWKAGPAKVSTPGMAGMMGRDRGPTPLTTTSASSVVLSSRVRCQDAVASLHVWLATPLPNRA